MAAEQSPPGKEPNSPHIGGRNAEDASLHEALYGRPRDPILRIDELEARVAALTQRLQAGEASAEDTEESVDERQLPNSTGLLARAEALESQLTSDPEDQTELGSATDHGPAAAEDRDSWHQRDQEIDQLRFHISNLASQLARTEEELRALQGMRVRRRSRSHHRRGRFWNHWIRHWRTQVRGLLG